MKESSKTVLKKVSHKFRSYDKFSVGRPANKIDFDGNGPGYKSYMGACISILYIIMVCVFLYSKCATWLADSSIKINMTMIDGMIDQKDVFGNEQGFFVAAAITAYDSETEVPKDLHRYGELVFERQSFGIDEQGETYNRKIAMETDYCTDEELGLVDESEYHVHSTYEKEIQLWKRKFKCAKPDDYYLSGNYHTSEGNLFNIGFKRCQGDENNCYDTDKINDWLESQYIVLLYHQARFDPNEFFDSTRLTESIIHYVPISSQVRQRVPIKVQQQEAFVQDFKSANFETWTRIVKEDLFHFEDQQIQPLRTRDTFQVKVSFEMSLSMQKYTRSRYNFLDVLANVGGFMGIFRWIFTVFMAAWNTNALDNFLAQKLFKVKGLSDSGPESKTDS